MSLSCCNRQFASQGALAQHRKNKVHYDCLLCNRKFPSATVAEEHRLAAHRFECSDCGLRFKDSYALVDHEQSKGHGHFSQCDKLVSQREPIRKSLRSWTRVAEFWCEFCAREFRNAAALEQHHADKRHWGQSANFTSPAPVAKFRCDDCGREFRTEAALKQHHADKRHWGLSTGSISRTRSATSRRDIRQREFQSEVGLEQHQADKRHGSDPPTFKCGLCPREFKDETARQQHMYSVVHSQLADIKCINSPRCKKHFDCPSAFLHHLESGYCRGGFARQQLNTIIQDSDTEQWITIPPSPAPTLDLLTGSSTASSSSGSIILTPVSGGSADGTCFSPKLDVFDEDPWAELHDTSRGDEETALTNGGFVCWLCNKKPFRSASALESHLTSLAHARKVFQCPPSAVECFDTPKPRKRFATLSGLTQHLESEVQQGRQAGYEEVVRFVERKLRENVDWDCCLLDS